MILGGQLNYGLGWLHSLCDYTEEYMIFSSLKGYIKTKLLFTSFIIEVTTTLKML